VEQAVPARQHADDRAEVEQLENGAFVDLPDFDIRRQLFDPLARRFAAFR
jgi:hypothetical protein